MEAKDKITDCDECGKALKVTDTIWFGPLGWTCSEGCARDFADKNPLQRMTTNG